MKKVIIILMIVLVAYFPIEFGIDEIDNIEDKYIIVTYSDSTDSLWSYCGGDFGYLFNNSNDLHLIGTQTPNLKYSYSIVDTSNNYYICYVDYVGEKSFVKKNFVNYPTFNVKKCEIMAPIYRNDVIPKPYGYICLLDILFKKIVPLPEVY